MTEGRQKVRGLQPANLWKLDRPAQLGPMNGPWLRRIALQRQVTTPPAVVLETPTEDAAQVLLVEHDDLIQTISAH